MRAVQTLMIVTLVAASWPRPAAAQPVRPYVDPGIRSALQAGRDPRGQGPAQIEGRIAVPVTITLAAEATAADLASLAQVPGVRLRLVEGRALHRGRLVPALTTAEGLERLARRPGVARLSAGVGRGPVPPLDHTTALVGVGAARRTWVGDQSLTGRGVLLADIDTSVEIFHPDFFAADGGAYDWLDVDADGALSPGVDAVDLDADGEADPDETLRVLTAEIYDYSYGMLREARPEGFSAGWDWLYADTDLDAERGFGPAAGFDEATPAYGEPLFIVDDLDGDDELDVGERLLRLATSRIRAVYVSSAYGRITVYRRGVDLIELPDAPLGQGAYGMPEAMHATGVLSIAAGGVPHRGRPLTGFAPEAEIVVAYEGGYDLVSAAIWALDEGADVVLHEYAPWTTVTLDGSDELSLLVDDSTEDGVVHVCPVGNTGGARKHAMATLAAPDGTAELTFEAPRWLRATYTAASLHWRPGTVTARVTLVTPGGERHELDDDYAELSVDGTWARYWRVRSAGGTGMLHLEIWDGSDPMPAGDWRFEISVEGAGSDVVVHGYLMDDVSSWGQGVAWQWAIANDVSNIGLPSTATACLAVAASAGHEGSPAEWWFQSAEGEEQGEVRVYSGRGPRIDGLQKPDLIAPDNPFAAFPRWADYEIGQSTYWVFGGTSGAGPHVAGAALLLAQLEPEGGGREIIETLLEGAAADALTGEVPNTAYGFGRVSLEGALGLPAGGGVPPVLALEAQGEVGPGAVVTVHPVVSDADGDAEAAQIRWDVGYDGTWDGAFAAVADLPVEISADLAGRRLPVAAEVRDETGLLDRTALWIAVPLPDGDADADVDADADADSDADADADAGPDADGEPRPSFTTAGGSCQCEAAGGGRGAPRAIAALLRGASRR